MAHRDFPPYQAVDFVLRNVLRHMPVTAATRRAALWWGFRYQAGPRIVRLRDGSRIQVEPVDYLRALLYYQGTFEPQCLGLLPRYLKAGETMLDIGANIGVFTLTAARLVGPRGRVISVEAVPPNAEALRSNVSLNHLDWVDVVEAAAWSSDGVTTLGLPEGGNLGMYSVAVKTGTLFEVPTRRIDDVIEDQGCRRVSLLKMDIEGAECEALRGASRLLADHKPTIIIEINERALNRCGASSRELIGLLDAAGYVGQVIEKDGMKPLGDVSPNACLECLFQPTGGPSLPSG